MSSAGKRISIVGFGLMGSQIAQIFATIGYTVSAYDVSNEKLDSGLSLIRSGKYGLENSVAKGRMSAEQASKVLDNIETTASLNYALADAEVVLEAAVEDLETKRKILKSASESAPKDAILATNTSTLSISKISGGLSQDVRRRVAGMHFFNPPQVMKLVEIVASDVTSREVTDKLRQIALDLKKVPIVVKDHPGFVANRIGIAVFAEASDLLAKGVSTVRDIDLAMRLGYGYPLGPFELGDLVGLDSRLRNMETLYGETHDEKFKPPELLARLVASGYLGDPRTKEGSKGGYYEYFGENRPTEETVA